LFRFPFHSSHCTHSKGKRTYQYTAFAVLEDMIYCLADTKVTPASVQGVGFDFRLSTTLWNVFLTELRDSVVFSVVQTVIEFQRVGEFRLGYVRSTVG